MGVDPIALSGVALAAGSLAVAWRTSHNNKQAEKAKNRIESERVELDDHASARADFESLLKPLRDRVEELELAAVEHARRLDAEKGAREEAEQRAERAEERAVRAEERADQAHADCIEKIETLKEVLRQHKIAVPPTC